MTLTPPLLPPRRKAIPSAMLWLLGTTAVAGLIGFAMLFALGFVVFGIFVAPSRDSSSRNASAITDISIIGTAIDAVEVDTTRYPTTGEGLQALLVAPSGIKQWAGPYLKSMPIDPWGRPYIYCCPGEHNKETYDLSSAGPDGKAGTADDIANWYEETESPIQADHR